MLLSQPQRPVRQHSQLPLINIAFLMLIFFLLAGTIAPAYELDVAPPTTENADTGSVQRSTVYVSKDGQVSFHNTLMDIDQLGAAAADRSPDEPDNLRVVVDQEADGQLLIDIVAQLRQAGLSKVYLVTRQGEP